MTTNRTASYDLAAQRVLKVGWAPSRYGSVYFFLPPAFADCCRIALNLELLRLQATPLVPQPYFGLTSLTPALDAGQADRVMF